MIKVSVIIPVWNQEKLLRKAVNSLPLDEDIEVIIVDDGSTDKSWEVAQELSAHPKIRSFHLEENCGVSAARNLGLDKASGEYVFMLDSDDWVYKNEFKKAMKMLDGVDMLYYHLRINNNNIWRVNRKTKKTFVGTTKFIRREFIGDTRYREDKRYAEDWFFYQELVKKKPTEKFSNLVIIHYNHPRDGSLSVNH